MRGAHGLAKPRRSGNSLGGMKVAPKALAASWLVSLASLGCNPSPSPPDQAKITVAQTVQPSVAWPPPSSVDARALEATGAAERVARSPVPILAPASVRLESPVLVVEGEFYSLTGRLGGAKITIQGTRAAKKYDHIPPAEGDRDLGRARGFVSVNEGIRTASWVEGGVAYSLDVECEGERDERCASDGFVTSLVARLAYVGGRGR